MNIHETIDIDEVDRTIIDALRSDGRLTVPQLAERVGVSRATAYARFDRLNKNGAIQGFEAIVAPPTLGLEMGSLAYISANQRSWEAITADLLATSGVQWVGVTTGRYDYVALLRATDLNHLRDVVLRELLAVEGVRNVETSVLLDEVRAPGGIF